MVEEHKGSDAEIMESDPQGRYQRVGSSLIYASRTTSHPPALSVAFPVSSSASCHYFTPCFTPSP